MACVGVVAAIETVLPGFWTRCADGAWSTDEQHANAFAARETATWLAQQKSKPADDEIAAAFTAALKEWEQQHALNLEYR